LTTTTRTKMMHPSYDLWGNVRPPSKLKRINRVVAERKLARVISRATAVNCDPDTETLHYIRRMWVLGSYLGDADTLGDLDISVQVLRRPSYSFKAATELAERKAPNYRSGCGLRFGWDRYNTLKRLKNHDGYIHLVSLDEVVDFECEIKLIFDAAECGLLYGEKTGGDPALEKLILRTRREIK
jgi:hypothetical protein